MTERTNDILWRVAQIIVTALLSLSGAYVGVKVSLVRLEERMTRMEDRMIANRTNLELRLTYNERDIQQLKRADEAFLRELKDLQQREH